MYPLLGMLLCCVVARAEVESVEVHQVLDVPANEKVAALTLDACSSDYDADLIRFLTSKGIPATIFSTKRWINRQPGAVAELRRYPDLFDIEDHGERHVPAVLGAGRMIYGLRGNADVEHLKREITVGADAIRSATGRAPR